MAQDTKRDLTGLFAPKSIAIIGASERNVFSVMLASNLRAVGYKGKAFAVNRDGKPAHGFPGFPSVAAIGEPVDAAYVGIPSASVIPAIEDAAACGIRNFVVVSGGFAETGPAGAEAQAALRAVADRLGLNILGPNCLGHINFSASAAVGALTVESSPPVGGLALVSASGALVSQMVRFAERQNIGLSHAIASGNEAVLNAGEIIAALVEDPKVRAIGLFLEEPRDLDRFIEAAKAARAARKAIVVVKVGASPIAATVAQAHTGAVTGDDAAFDRLCDDYGLVRVNTLEDLVITGALLAERGVLPTGGAAFISMSGGACELVADAAARDGLDLAAFAPEVSARLHELVAAGGLGSVNNPLDLTGAVARNTELWEDIYDTIAQDPGVGVIVALTDQPSQWERTETIEKVLASIARAQVKHGKRSLFVNSFTSFFSDYDREFQEDAKLGVILPSIGSGVTAIARAVWWAKHIEKHG
jgi:acetate---CoA ligase (ADP-forming)